MNDPFFGVVIWAALLVVFGGFCCFVGEVFPAKEGADEVSRSTED